MGAWEAEARAAYGAYCVRVGGRAFNGDTLPSWEEQQQRNPQIAEAWEAAAEAACRTAAAR